MQSIHENPRQSLDQAPPGYAPAAPSAAATTRRRKTDQGAVGYLLVLIGGVPELATETMTISSRVLVWFGPTAHSLLFFAMLLLADESHRGNSDQTISGN